FVWDQENNLWLLTKEGQLRRYTAHGNRLSLAHTYGNTQPVANFFFAHGRLFFQTQTGSLYDIDTKTFQTKALATSLPAIRAMAFYKGHFIVAWSNLGCDVYTASFTPSAFLQQELTQIQSMKITSWNVKDGLLWAGTDGNGLLKIMPQAAPFAAVHM